MAVLYDRTSYTTVHIAYASAPAKSKRRIRSLTNEENSGWRCVIVERISLAVKRDDCGGAMWGRAPFKRRELPFGVARYQTIEVEKGATTAPGVKQRTGHRATGKKQLERKWLGGAV